ncbi:NUDIX hydrolase [Gemella taiwanensis]
MIIDYLGIYGMCIKENKVLCIKKARGPYKNRYDLPGGSQKTSEGFTETLVREFLEETGYKVISYDNCRAYDVFVKEEERTVHHMMVFYDVEIESHQLEEIQTILDDEINDSDGIC